MANNRVTAAAVVVPVNGTDRYLYRGALIPEGVKPEEIKRLKSIGLIEEVKVRTAPTNKAQAPADSETPGPAGKTGDSGKTAAASKTDK